MNKSIPIIPGFLDSNEQPFHIYQSNQMIKNIEIDNTFDELYQICQ